MISTNYLTNCAGLVSFSQNIQPISVSFF